MKNTNRLKFVRSGLKRCCVIAALLISTATVAFAQTAMTDEQVMEFVLREQGRGTTQAQIVTKLMQNGVDIGQLRRVRAKAERLQKNQGLGTVLESSQRGASDDRTRTNNAQLQRQQKNNTIGLTEEEQLEMLRTSPYRVRDTRQIRTNGKTMREDDLMLMEDELNAWIPDSTALLERLLEERRQMMNKKKVFGRDIFNNEDLTFEPAMNIATPQNYTLGPGDVVYVDVYGASQKSIECTVSPDGDIVIEGYGPINVGGLSVAQANARLKQTLGSRYQSSQVKMSLGQTRTITVNVMGEVNAPGTYTISAFASVFNALYLAGGTSELGTLRNIKVFRNNRLISNVDIYDYILNGNMRGNVRLHEGDVIIVGPYDCLVSIEGKVKRPMYYEMKKNESVATLLRYAGGFTGDAYTKAVRLIRKTGKEYSVHNVEEFDMASFHLSDGDSVSVDSILNRFSNMAEIKGAVFRPGMFQVGGNIQSVKQLIEAAEGLKEEAFTAHAVMHRMKEDRTLEVMQIDIDGIMKGTVPDLPLKPNDVLFVPTKEDMMEEQTITIHGEVQFPGVYKYAENETLEDFVLQAGGLKKSASTVKVDVARRMSNPKALQTDTIIARTFTFALKDGFVVDGEPGFTLMPFDEVYVRKSPGYYEQQNVTVDGEVMFSGTYTLDRKNTRLSDLIKAAGGVNDRAYVAGARIERKYNEEERKRAEQVQRKVREEMMAELQEQAAKTGNANLMNMNTNQTMQKYQISDTYPVGIELDKALANPGGNEDIVLREDDRLIVPQYNATVKINGEVMYPNTVGYKRGKSVAYYLDQAGGVTSKGKKSQTYIIYMNGTVAKVGHGVKPQPGCEIMVPPKNISKMTTAEKLSMATAVGSFATIIATIANILK